MRLDLKFHSIDEENYNAEEPSGSSFLAEIFLNYGKTISYPNQVQNTISNFSQDGYYPNCLYDSSIYPHPYSSVYNNNIIYQQPNPTVQPCHIYNFFDVSSSTYQESKIEDNWGNLGDDLDLNVFNDNLSLGMIEEQNTIGGSSVIDLTTSLIILTPVMKLSDDQNE
jgi:hypothetical protein